MRPKGGPTRCGATAQVDPPASRGGKADINASVSRWPRKLYLALPLGLTNVGSMRGRHWHDYIPFTVLRFDVVKSRGREEDSDDVIRTSSSRTDCGYNKTNFWCDARKNPFNCWKREKNGSRVRMRTREYSPRRNRWWRRSLENVDQLRHEWTSPKKSEREK